MKSESRNGWRIGLGALLLLAACAKRRPPASDVAVAAVEPPPPPPTLAADDDDAAASAAWTIEVAEGGTLRVSYRGAQIMSFHYSFWGPNFSWANPVVKGVKTSDGVTTFEIGVDTLGLDIAGKITKSGPGELTVEYGIAANKELRDITGGGLEFNLSLDAPVPGKGNAPVLLADSRGFKWEAAANDSISVAFDQPLPAAFFERGQQSAVRCFLVGKDVSPGTRKVAMKVRLPQGGAVRKSIDERYGRDDRASWYPETLGWDKWPVDVGFLNERPAGKHGRVKADGESLRFEDGTPVRFWGANLQAYALFRGKKEDVANQAKRIAALGYNLVRLHHHDSDWVSPNVFEKGATTQKLDDAALDSLDWWVKCLKDEGIYVWLDLHVGRQFQKGDNIDGFAELAKQQGSGKGFNYVNPRIEKLMQEFADKYVTRTNRYTGKTYVDEPALAFVLVTNENDLTFHFANLLLPDKGNPVHHRLFETQAREIARRAGLGAAAALKTWEPGPAKIVLNEIEHEYDVRAIARLRADGVKALVATTSFWGAQSVYSLPSLAAGDVVDVHSYGKAESLGTNPRYESNFISWIGAAQIAGKPLSITEWNVEYPSRDRFIAPLYVAAIGSLQGWDAPMIYGYSQVPVEKPEKADTYSTWNDPALTALMPAAALMFRQGHVKEAQKTYRLDLSRENLYYANTSPDTSAAIRTLVERSKLTVGLPDIPELAWDDALSSSNPNATAFTDVTRDFIPQGQNYVESDTGELKRDWSLGIETIDTPLSQAAIGWIGRRRLALRDVTFDIQTPKAAVAVTSMDGKPIAESKKILVTMVAQVAAGADDKLPFVAQPVEGTIGVRAKEPLRLVPLSPRENPGGAAPERAKPILPARQGDLQSFTVTRGVATHWFLLVPDVRPNGR
jgi:hypothetical protein